MKLAVVCLVVGENVAQWIRAYVREALQLAEAKLLRRCEANGSREGNQEMRRTRLLTRGVVPLLVLVLNLLAVAPVLGDAPPFNVIVPLAGTDLGDVSVDCAAGGAGETVLLEGRLHALIHTTTDASGGVHDVVNFHSLEVTGIGQTTGDIYHGTNSDKFRINIIDPPSTFTNQNTISLHGQGTASDFVLQATLHVTVNANGDITAEFDNVRISCK